MKRSLLTWLCISVSLGLAACAPMMPTTLPATPAASAAPASAQAAPQNLPKPAQKASVETSFLPPPAPQAISLKPPEADASTSQSPLGLKADAILNPTRDLWDRIRRGFAMPDLQDEFVANREQWYSARPDYIARMTERSKKYLYHVVEELEARGMPTELALLPFIESAFNPQAVSSAKAAGMWQFIPSTGKYYSLKQNTFRDDRRDVLASTRAALDYLQRLYTMFGDWHLALAAYNWGEGSVSRAIAKNQRLGLPTGYSDLAMPNETRYYVPKLQAVKNIIANPALFNAQIDPIANHPYFRPVPITRDIDVALAAKLADVPLEDFKALNPSFSRPVILAAGTPQVLMPWANADSFSAKLDRYPGQLASWTAWTAPISLKPKDAAKRFGMSEAHLREVNGIASSKGLIAAGSTLLVPRSAYTLTDVAAHIADNGQLTLVTPKAPKAKSKTTARASTKSAPHTKTSASGKATASKTSSATPPSSTTKRKQHAQK